MGENGGATDTRTSCGLVPARCRVRRRLAEGSAEMLVHHRADVALEVGEEDAAGAQVLSARRQLLVLLFDGWRPRGAQPAAALLGVLHFGIQSQLLEGTHIDTECVFSFVLIQLPAYFCQPKKALTPNLQTT